MPTPARVAVMLIREDGTAALRAVPATLDDLCALAPTIVVVGVTPDGAMTHVPASLVEEAFRRA